MLLRHSNTRACPHDRHLCGCTGAQDSCTGAQVYRNTGVQEHRCTCAPEHLCSCVGRKKSASTCACCSCPARYSLALVLICPRRPRPRRPRAFHGSPLTHRGAVLEKAIDLSKRDHQSDDGKNSDNPPPSSSSTRAYRPAPRLPAASRRRRRTARHASWQSPAPWCSRPAPAGPWQAKPRPSCAATCPAASRQRVSTRTPQRRCIMCLNHSTMYVRTASP